MIKVLVPTDFSENASHALRYAIFLFKKEESTFYILNAFQTSAFNLVSLRNKERKTGLFQITKEASERGMQEVLTTAKMENDNPKHFFKTLAVADTLLNAIGKSVLDYNMDYIFMGTQGASRLKGVFFGSNTIKVISNIDFRPIIAVPADYSFDMPYEILFATGFEHMYNKYELRPMIILAKLFDAKIRVLHLVDTNKKEAYEKTAKKVIAKRLHEVPFEIIEIEKKGEVAATIEKVVAQNEFIGMVGIIEYWHSFMEKLTHESIVKNVAFRTKVPLLVMHLPK